MTSQISINFSWPGGEEVITDERNTIKETLIMKASDIKEKNPDFSGAPKFMKFSKFTKKYCSCELKDLNDGDSICVTFTNGGNPKSNLVGTNVSDDQWKIIKQKLYENGHLTGNDRKFLYDILTRHGEHCFAQQQECISENSKKRKLDNSNNDENKLDDVSLAIPKDTDREDRRRSAQMKSNKKIITHVGIQCDLPVYTDFWKMEEMLREMYKTYKSESWNPRKQRVFEIAYSHTFGARRHFIVSDDPPSASAIKNVYPYLFHKDQVLMEFELIANRTNMLESFKRNVEIYSEVLLQHTTNSKLNNKIKKCMSTSKDSKWIASVGSLLLLPAYMKEERKGLILYKDEKLLPDYTSSPYIRSTGNDMFCLERNQKFHIYIDEIELCTTSDLIEAHLALMASYYIFNVSYPDCAAGTYACLERLYIEHTDEHSFNIDEPVEDKIKFLSVQSKLRRKKLMKR